MKKVVLLMLCIIIAVGLFAACGELEPVKFTVTFDTQGGSEVAPIVVEQGKELTIPDNPTKEGYTFVAWYLDSEFVNNFDIDNPTIVDNVTLYAKWVPTEFNINYNNLGGAVNNNPPSINVEDGNITLPDINRDGYNFLGWYDNAEFSGDRVTTINANSLADINLYAKWEVIEYTITYHNVDNAINNNPTNYNVESNITLADGELEGYTFLGWYDNVELSGEAIINISAGSLGNLNLYAKWEISTYTIYYDNTKGVEHNNPTMYNILSEDITLAPLGLAGYNFLGWFKNTDTGEEEITVIPQSSYGDIHLYAKWEMIEYTITYHNLDGAINNNPKTYTIESDIIMLIDAVQQGYTFLGWYDSAELNGDIVTSISNGTLGNIDLYAKLEKKSYILSYDVKGGEPIESVILEYGTEFSNLPTPIRAGYEFKGWYLDEGYGMLAHDMSMPSCDTILYAKWDIPTYTVTFHWNKVLAEYELHAGDTIPKVEDPEQEGFIFKFWSTDHINAFDFSQPMPEEDITLYPVCGFKKYQFIYHNVDGATHENPTGFTFQDMPYYPLPATKEGYTFLGWYDNAEFSGNPVTELDANVPMDRHYYARWEAIEYNIVYHNADGATNNNPTTYTLDDHIVLQSASLGGYNFIGWYDNEELIGDSVVTINVNSLEDIELYAKWEIATYTITYHNMDVATHSNPSTYSIVDNVIVLQIDVQDGYYFLGWYDNADFTGEKITEIPSGSFGHVDLYAKIKILDFTFESYNNGYAITGYIGTDNIVEIPNKINNVAVECINDFAFSNCTSITSITIPNSVTNIGSGAFYGCYSLSSITIPDSVTTIGYGAFGECGLTSIIIPKNVTKIWEAPMSGCTMLESIIVAEGNTKYHSNGNCLIETESGTLLSGCKNSVIPSDGSVSSIGQEAFYKCIGLENVMIPEGVTSIGDFAFADCTGLTQITIPDSVTTIGDYAFYDCSNLIGILLPKGLISIGEGAFRNCSSMLNLIIPNTVTTIEEMAFGGCYSIDSIVVEDGNTRYHSDGDCLIETETATLLNGCKNSIIPEDGSVTIIGDYAFWDCINLISIKIPSSVRSIKEGAFQGCIGLIDLKISGGVTEIGSAAFFSCNNLASIIIPNSITSIGDRAFYFCNKLTSVTIPDSVINMGDYAFANSGLETVILLGNITNMGNWTFAWCNNLKNVVIPDSIVIVNEGVFSDCTALNIVYYLGNEEKKANMNIDSSNTCLIDATWYFYSATEPTEAGNYWYYDSEGNVVEW